ncbi:Ferredoxin-type protein NapG (periplasmic nitrate reductase) [hydrothermal vent metagenome]|uniref:Ferredoxin-type protein NapG (Periplasmic nitrate reductase) n=1 Tax=hydrothermal vent metagenome TaxID=652676 RepID=A0A1W1B992_9ZZZZ
MKKEVKKVHITPRRRFFTNIAQGTGMGIMGGLLWAGYAEKAKSSTLTLRPPAALAEEDFLKSCIKCGLCAEACLNRESNRDKETLEQRPATLKMAKAQDDATIGTPFFIPSDVPCYMCEDIPCVPVCPTGALDIDTVTNDSGELDFRMMDMGIAVVDSNSCIAFWGIQCDACYRACPLLDEAIKLEYGRNERTGKHAFLKPVVDMNICTGCGLCEKACVTEKPAIFIQPRELALGKPGDHYVKGWDQKDQQRVAQQSGKDMTTHTKRSESKAVDYLNTGVDFE